MSYSCYVHRKQFVLGPSAALSLHQWPERFKTVAIQDGLEVRFCPDQRVAQSVDGRVVLIGNVVEADHRKITPKEALEILTRDTIGELTKSWTGHWCLVIDGQLFVDFLGLMSVYLPRSRTLDKHGTFVVSSSPSLLMDFYNLESVTGLKEFQPAPVPPWCFHPGLKTLLAGECIDIASGRRDMSDFPPLEVFDATQDEILRDVSQLLIGTMEALSQNADSWVLSALTAGYDSRLNFAAAKAAGIDFDTFTFIKSYFFTSDADRIIPPQIAKQFAKSHRVIRSGEVSELRAREYISHAGGEVSSYRGNGFDHYSEGYWEQLGYGKTCLDGLCFELAVNYHDRRFKPDFTMDDLLTTGFYTTEKDFAYTIQHWNKLRDSSHNFDRRDLLFWTGNCNGAYSRVIQKHDLFTDLFIPACNRQQMNLLMSIPVSARGDCAFESQITKALLEGIDELPYNPKEPFHKKAYMKLRNIILSKL